MSSLNMVAIMGRLTHDPELKTTTTGKSVVSFVVAVDNYGDNPADFIKCKAWNKTAEFIAQYFRKGNPIAVDGSITTNRYEDKNGNKRNDLEIRVNNAHFCGSKSNDTPIEEKASEQPPQASDWEAPANEDDLPF